LLDEQNSEGMAKAFFAADGGHPATIIPILVRHFTAYALAWMEFPWPCIAGRGCWPTVGRAVATGTHSVDFPRQRNGTLTSVIEPLTRIMIS
jgi:hypothetical protein